MRPRYAFETKKPTKSASYQKPTKIWGWSQNGTKKKLCPLGAPADLKSADKKDCLASQRNSLEKHNNNKLKN